MVSCDLVIRPPASMALSMRLMDAVMSGLGAWPGWQRSRQQGALRMNHHDAMVPVVSACWSCGPRKVAAACSAVSQAGNSMRTWCQSRARAWAWSAARPADWYSSMASSRSAGSMEIRAAASCSGVPARTASTASAVACGEGAGVTFVSFLARGRWSVEQQAGVPSGAVAAAGVGVLDELAGQVGQAVGERGCAGVAGRPPGGLEQAGPAVAHAGVGDLAELGRAGQAVGESVFGHVLAGGVAGCDAGELLGSCQAGGAVAPARPQRPRLGGVAGVQFLAGDPLRPPGPGAAVLPPGIQPAADPIDGLVLAVDGNAFARGEGEQGKGSGDAVRDAEVRVAAGEAG